MKPLEVIFLQNSFILLVTIPLFLANIYYYWYMRVLRLRKNDFHFWMAVLLQLCFTFGILTGATAISFARQCKELDCFNPNEDITLPRSTAVMNYARFFMFDFFWVLVYLIHTIFSTKHWALSRKLH